MPTLWPCSALIAAIAFGPTLATAQRLATAQQPAAAPRAVGHFVHERWTVQDGLPVNSINAVVQGRDGYIWVATNDGLARFDGVRFTVFNTSNTPGLTSNRILRLRATSDTSVWLTTEQGDLLRFRSGHMQSLQIRHPRGSGAPLEDSHGRIWIAGASGLFRVEGDSAVPAAVPRVPGPVSALAERRAGGLWVGTLRKGLYALLEDGSSRQVHPSFARDSVEITAVLEDPLGRLWIASRAHVWVDDGQLRQVDTKRNPLPSVRALEWAPGLQGVYAFAGSGVHRLDGPSPRPGTASIDSGGIYILDDLTLHFDERGTSWLAMGRKLYRDNKLVYVLPDEDDAGRSTNVISSLTVDREGSVWLGTRADGLYRVKPAIFATISTPEGLAGPNVYSVFEDPAGSIWVGGLSRGPSRIAASGVVTAFPVVRGGMPLTNTFASSDANHLWVGSGAGLYRCALPAMRCVWQNVPALGHDPVWALFTDSHQRLWVGSSRAIRRENGNWIAPDPDDWPTTAPVRAFAETPDGAIWMGTNGAGLLRWDGSRAQRIAGADSIIGLLPRSLYVDRDGWLWVGTEGRGLARIDPRNWDASAANVASRIRHIRQSDGLLDATIHQILEDSAGRMWMNTNSGISWVTRSDLMAFADGQTNRVHATSYTEKDGLRNREGNGGMQPAGVVARDGRLWFPTQDGVVAVDPSRLKRNTVVPPVVIERVVTRDSALDVARGDVALGVDQRDIEVEYTALSFQAPANVRFRYRLDPYDDDWVDAGSRRVARYTSVPPGRYQFRVIAANNDGVWNETGATISLELAPRFWETRLFRFAVMAALLLSLAVAANAWRLRTVRRSRELEQTVAERTATLRRTEAQLEAQNAKLELHASKLEEVNELRSRLFANLSHEFRTPLTLILGPLRSLLDGRHGAVSPAWREQGELMHRNGQRLLRLINQLLDLSRLQAGAVMMDRRDHDYIAFARATALAFAPLAERRGVGLTFSTVPPSLEQLPFAFDAEQLEKVLLNLLSNALKFTDRGGEVEVTVTTAGHAGVETSVRDTGIGIAPEQVGHVFDRFFQADTSVTRRYEGTGIGLALARELVERHGGTIRVESAVSAGSTFTFTLPSGVRATAPSNGARTIGSHHAVEVGGALDASLLVEHAPAGSDAGIEQDEDRTTVLVVDDNADVRSYVRSVLAPTYRVLEAADGAAGLERARSRLPDCIVADVMMPELDGLALARALKDDPMTAAIPVILLTARAASDDLVTGLGTGADDYLVKPFDPAVLEARVANLLAQRQRLRALFAAGEAQPAVAAEVATPTAKSELEQRLRAAIQARLTDPELGADALAEAMGMSYQKLYRLMREAMGEGASPTRLIRGVRVERAAELLRQGAGSVTEVASSVGFESLSYFSRAYRERFGVSPSEHLRGAQAVK